MKKWISMLLFCSLVGTLTACGRNDTAEEPEKEPSQTEASGQGTADVKGPETEPESGETNQTDGEREKELVVYFSWSGNTENVANSIAAQTGADMFRIVPAEPYVDDYDELLDIASKEK